MQQYRSGGSVTEARQHIIAAIPEWTYARRIQTTNTDSPGSCPSEEGDEDGAPGALDVDGAPTALPVEVSDDPVEIKELPLAAGGIQLVTGGGRSSDDPERVETSVGRAAWMAL